MTTSSTIINHYGGGELLAAIVDGLAELGMDPSTATVGALAPVDEFHVGGRPATADLCTQLDLDATNRLLDVGCGIGGTARFIASTFGCTVTGIDLTPAYTAVAEALTEWTGLRDRVRFETGSALEMALPHGHFDRATLLHVGMNIDDKPRLFREIRRVLEPGGRFGVYDIMRISDGDIGYPVPWASDGSTSFVETPGIYRAALEEAGFVVTAERNRGDFAADFFATVAARAAQTGGPAPLGLHLIMGANAPTKIANMVSAVQAGLVAPVEMICEKPIG